MQNDYLNPIAKAPEQISVKSDDQPLGADTIILGLLLVSYFYVLPLGRYSFFGVATDFRIYDFAFIGFMLFAGLKYLPRLGELRRQRSRFHYWTIALIIVVWLSLIFTSLQSRNNLTTVFSAVLRAFRFSHYLLIPSLIVLIANTPRRQRFLTNIFYANILLQALLAFGQGLGWLPTFWPSYWLYYGKQTVGTLSPHHLQISIVMMLGLALSATYLRTARNPFQIIIAGGGAALMLAATIFSGTRTAWVSIPFMILAYLYIHRSKSIVPLIGLGLLVAVVFGALWGIIQDPIEAQIQTRLLDGIASGGLSEPLSDRLAIYDQDIINRLLKRPWVLVIGAGFQNVLYAIGAAGAHNNYLQAWFELGIVGLVVYLGMLKTILGSLRATAASTANRFAQVLSKDVWAAFIGVMVSMLAGETLWAQYSMFTLSGQILALVGLAACPLFWDQHANQKPSDAQLANTV
ncbi:O-antigen ligase family protein [Chloroflexota bacterium]